MFSFHHLRAVFYLLDFLNSETSIWHSAWQGNFLFNYNFILCFPGRVEQTAQPSVFLAIVHLPPICRPGIAIIHFHAGPRHQPSGRRNILQTQPERGAECGREQDYSSGYRETQSRHQSTEFLWPSGTLEEEGGRGSGNTLSSGKLLSGSSCLELPLTLYV